MDSYCDLSFPYGLFVICYLILITIIIVFDAFLYENELSTSNVYKIEFMFENVLTVGSAGQGRLMYKNI
jgi:hypothetical protein